LGENLGFEIKIDWGKMPNQGLLVFVDYRMALAGILYSKSFGLLLVAVHNLASVAHHSSDYNFRKYWFARRYLLCRTSSDYFENYFLLQNNCLA